MSTAFDLTLGFPAPQDSISAAARAWRSDPTNVSIGPVTMTAISVELKPAGGTIPLKLGADVAFSLGPIAVVVQNMGPRWSCHSHQTVTVTSAHAG